MLHIGSSHVHLAGLPAADVPPHKGPAVRVVALADNGAVVNIPLNRCGNAGDSCLLAAHSWDSASLSYVNGPTVVLFLGTCIY